VKLKVGDCVTFWTAGNILKEDYIKSGAIGLVLEIKTLNQSGHLIDNDIKCLVLWNDKVNPEWVNANSLDIAWKKQK
tara:strand:+ start:161 stop:391 length:231 start_codon:yes stop_codon:yes gene_type:complete